MTNLEIMKAARALITPPGSWTQDTYALDADGNEVGPSSESATCYCSSGAISRISGSIAARVIEFAEHISCIYGVSIPVWNDHPDRTHEEVLAEFDEVIAKLEAAQ